jgi:hypothetical protein
MGAREGEFPTEKEQTMNEHREEIETRGQAVDAEIVELPLEVVPDWDEQVAEAEALCRLVDLHLDHEAQCRGLTDRRAFGPRHLCREQRVQMASDLCAAAR